jgi:hypothetical protein
MSNTNAYEDAICVKCSDFGGVASDCADIVERLDSLINERDTEIEQLKDEIKQLEFDR